MNTENNAQRSTVLPIGRNCHLGAALTRFGYHETSLFRWAEASLARVQAFLDGADVFAGRTAYRFAGAAFGTLDHAAMRARLTTAPAGAKINTIVFDQDEQSYVHGVQLTLEVAARSDVERIRAANAEKVDHLKRKFRVALSGEAAPLALRLEWTPIVEIEPFARLGEALRRLNPAAQMIVAAPAGGFEGERGGVRFVGLSAPLPPLADVMNVETTQAEWAALFADLGVAPQGAEKAYIFDI